MAALTSTPSNRRERKKQALRNRIIDEALSLIAAQGVEELTIDVICVGADISRKTFYNYYGTKHELLFDICVSRLLELTEGTIDDALAKHTGLRQRLQHVIGVQKEHLCNGTELEHEIARYSIASIGNSLASGATLLSVMNNNFLRLYEASLADIRPGLSPGFCAEMTVGMIDTVILNALHNPEYDTAGRYDQLLEYLCGSMLRADNRPAQK